MHEVFKKVIEKERDKPQTDELHLDVLFASLLLLPSLSAIYNTTLDHGLDVKLNHMDL